MDIQKIVIILIALVIVFKYSGESFWYSNQVSTADGDKCIIKDGIMVCEDKGTFPSWFYPSYWYPTYSYYPYYDLPYYYYYPYYPRRFGRRGGILVQTGPEHRIIPSYEITSA